MIPEKVKKIMQTLLDNGFEAHIIGGAVRDILLNVEPNDYDIFSNCSDLLKVFPKGKIMGGLERQEKILTVIVNDIEVSQYRSNGNRTKVGKRLVDHQWTCDFYMNALAMDINGEICGDQTIKRCALSDLIDTKKINFVGKAEERLEEDPLRLLRLIRFAAKYNFCFNLDNINMEYREELINKLPVERIKDEFMKILQYEKGLELLHEYGLLKIILPELYHKNHFKDGGDHHKETPFEHTLNCFKEAHKVTDNVLLKLTCLLHDIGKGKTRTEENKEIHFYEHETIGCDIVREFMSRLKYSNEEIKYVTTLIRKHMWSYKDKKRKKSYIKHFKSLEEANIDIMDYVIMIYADNQGNMLSSRKKLGDFVKNSWVLNKYWELKHTKEPFTVKELNIGGKDLIEKFGMKPSPKMGEILNDLFEKVMDGELTNERKDLLNYLKTKTLKSTKKRKVRTK